QALPALEVAGLDLPKTGLVRRLELVHLAVLALGHQGVSLAVPLLGLAQLVAPAALADVAALLEALFELLEGPDPRLHQLRQLGVASLDLGQLARIPDAGVGQGLLLL